MEALEAQVKMQESQLTSQNLDSQRSFRSVETSERSLGELSLPSPGPPREGTREQPITISDEGSTGPSQTEGVSQTYGHSRKRDFETYTSGEGESQGSTDTQPTTQVSWVRLEAYNAMMRNVLGTGEGGWEGIPLISAGGGHSRAEPELGG